MINKATRKVAQYAEARLRPPPAAAIERPSVISSCPARPMVIDNPLGLLGAGTKRTEHHE